LEEQSFGKHIVATPKKKMRDTIYNLKIKEIKSK
jgi:hypothetical protein